MTPQPIQDIAQRLYSEVAQTLKDAWDQRLTQADRDLVRACCDDAAELQVRALSAPQNPEAQLQLLRDKAQINAQLCNLTAIEGGQAIDAFWSVVRTAVSGAVAIAFAVV